IGLSPTPHGSFVLQRFEGSSSREVCLWLAPIGSEPERPRHGDETSALGAKSGAVLRPFKTAIAKRAPRHFAILKLQRAIRKNLIILVALSSQQHDVAGARLIHGHADSFFAVRLDQIFSSRLF